MHRVPVVGGPLRGTWLAMPALTRASFITGTYQPHVLREMRRFVAPGGVAYDLGAHIGYFTLILSRLVGTQGSVFSFEPDPRNLDALAANLGGGGTANVTVVRSAVSDASGQVTFATFDFSSVGHIADARTPGDARLVTVECVTLDDFVFSRGCPAPSFLKIDVEGAETRVLRGAERVLREVRPVVVVEVRGPGRWAEVSTAAQEAGYRGYLLGGDGRLARAGYGDALLVPEEMTHV